MKSRILRKELPTLNYIELIFYFFTFVFISTIYSTIIHEIGHAIFLFALDRPPRKIVIGTEGKRILFKFKLFYIDIIFNKQFIFGGRCIFQCKGIHTDSIIARIFIYSGGIIFNLASSIARYIYIINFSNYIFDFSTYFIFVFCGINFIGTVGNLLIINNVSDGGKIFRMIPFLFSEPPPAQGRRLPGSKANALPK
ncbi:MAG: hypothetical protein A4E53_00127 [Pelotomaculum sp. PtaB.Bin104]|nr:MAG: hypothetical protein A4E53_00127 [Pelotomaculum sp. PtaB.Bin104]